MAKWICSVMIVLAVISYSSVSESVVQAFPSCAEVLQPAKGINKSARGVALMYGIERKFNNRRTSLSVHALHLPKPSSLGKYNGYEVVAYIPKEISWVFPLQPIMVHEDEVWVGIEEEISLTNKPKIINVHAVNTGTKQRGPIVLKKQVKACR